MLIAFFLKRSWISHNTSFHVTRQAWTKTTTSYVLVFVVNSPGISNYYFVQNSGTQKKKIDVLLLQETHGDAPRQARCREKINVFFGSHGSSPVAGVMTCISKSLDVRWF